MSSHWLTEPISEADQRLFDEGTRLGFMGDGLRLFIDARKDRARQRHQLKNVGSIVALLLTFIAFLILRLG